MLIQIRKWIASVLNCFVVAGVAELLCSFGGSTNHSENKTQVDSAVMAQVQINAQDTTVVNPFTGMFEYHQPNQDGYLYYKIDLVQQCGSVKGKLYADNYLGLQWSRIYKS